MDKVRSFTMKLELWEEKVKDGNLSMFEHLSEALDKSENTGELDAVQLVQSHLASLRMELQSYFPELSEMESKLIRNPFIIHHLEYWQCVDCVPVGCFHWRELRVHNLWEWVVHQEREIHTLEGVHQFLGSLGYYSSSLGQHQPLPLPHMGVKCAVAAEVCQTPLTAAQLWE
ncbi:Zinc finger BED domain-containing protein 5 [Portunus trituberculatus]|uniref:Zinc finger BED domain-containing protein 5 n=1 Tax=Portunus trituberculatus TaxID=210409 RepID=A0A5B7GVZ2_PORTR|nr:Zinc finger BED domain-containing protein 5 [Portunus trituberculatus]